MSDHPLLTIRNGHVASCGVPPHFESPLRGLSSYFQNEHGEQWVFRYEAGDAATVWGGDIGWDNPVSVRIDGSDLSHGSSELPHTWLMGEWVLNQPEWLWVGACCAAAFERRKGRP